MPLILVNARSLQLECTVLHESLLMPVLTYSSEAKIWKWRVMGRDLAPKDNGVGCSWTVNKIIMVSDIALMTDS